MNKQLFTFPYLRHVVDHLQAGELKSRLDQVRRRHHGAPVIEVDLAEMEAIVDAAKAWSQQCRDRTTFLFTESRMAFATALALRDAMVLNNASP